MFELHPQLAADTVVLGRLPLSVVLLAKDANYPWCILVPQRSGIREIHQLGRDDQQQLLKESSGLAEIMEALFKADKMNIAALGNMVPQLHIHHIARFTDDAAWPKPIWTVVPAIAYDKNLLDDRILQLTTQLQKMGLVVDG